MSRRRLMSVKTVDYVKSNNSFVDTGVSPSDNISVEIDFEGVSLIDNQALFGTWTESISFQVTFFANKWYYGSGSVESIINMPVPFTSRQIISYNLDKKIYINGSLAGNVNTFVSASDRIWLFRRNLTYIYQPCPSYIKLYSCKIYNSGNLIRDFIPAKQGNTYCLYDTVTKTYYYDQYNNLTI